MALEVQCIETEEHLTIVEMGSPDGGFMDSSKGMKSRIYHWGQTLTPPAGVPQMQVPQARTPETEGIEKPETASTSKTPGAPPTPFLPAPSDAQTPASTDNPKPNYPLPPDAKPVPIQIETAKPSNWHESWGKADDHHTDLTTEKISQSPPPNTEPQAIPSVPPSSAVIPQSSPDMPPTTTVEQISTEASLEVSREPEKTNVGANAEQPAGYSHIDDRPGIAHVTDIPPGGAKTAYESKKPVMDFLRTLWKPNLKDPAPLQSIQIAELPAVAPAAPNPQQFQSVLQESLLPSEREMAAEALSGFPRQQDPTIVPALLHAATNDPASTVRAACVHGLVKMNANSSEVIGVLTNLKADPDLRVRREVHQALISFGLAKPEPENEMIHQISAPGGRIGEW
jgi:hypothetical protein